MSGSTLLEREELLEQLAAHASAAAAGDGRLVFVAGEAGVGKTSLVERFLGRLPSGSTALVGACDSMSVPMPLGPVLDFAARVSTEFGTLIGSGAERNAIFASLLSELHSGGRLKAVVVEDLHWADDATLDLLRFLGRRVGSARALLVCTYREEEVGARHPLRQLLGDVAGASTVHRMRVPPLSLEAVSLLAVRSGLDPAELHRRTGGNPFFVTEVLAGAGEGVPERAGDAVLGRVMRLSPSARDAAELVSLLGHEASVGLVSGLVSSPEAVDECVAAGLLVSSASRLSFRHDIAREAVAGSVTPARRQAAHAAALAALEADSVLTPLVASGRALDDAQEATAVRAAWLATLSHHAAGAGDAAALLRYALSAGRLALKLLALREARLQFARVLPLSDALPLEEAAQLHSDHGRVCFLLDDMEAAAESHSGAEELWQRTGCVEPRVKNLMQLANRLRSLNRGADADAAAKEAVRLADDLPADAAVLADVYNFKAFKSELDREEALAWAAKAAESARLTGNHRGLAISHLAVGYAELVSGRIARARRAIAASAAEAARHDLHDLVADLHLDGGMILSIFHRFAAADLSLDTTIALSQDRALEFECSLNYGMAYKAGSHLYQGRWREASEDAMWVLARPGASSIPRYKAMTTLGLLRARRGDPEAQDVLDEAVGLACSKLARATVRTARAEVARLRGCYAEAIEEASEAYEDLRGSKFTWQIEALAYQIWKAGGDPDLPDEIEGPYAWQIRGRPEVAARRWRRLACPYEQAVALTECDEVVQLSQALEIFAALGARPMLARTTERLRQLGVRGIPRGPRSATRSDPAGLTPRERQVLEFMEQGLRNAEIAERNRVSPRTVENQVSAVLGKLGVRTRTEAVAEAHRRGWIQAP